MKQFIWLSLMFTFLSEVVGQTVRKAVSANTMSYNDSIFFSKTKYRLIGPFRGGRSAAVAGSYKNKNTFYFGATGGGIWKTTDGGSNWKNISDKYFGGSMGSVSVAPGDEGILYAGEGENTLRGSDEKNSFSL